MELRRMGRELVLALRLLRRRPGAALIAVLTLAVGVGATTAMFSVVEQVLLAPLPFPQPEQLMLVHEALVRAPDMNVSWPDYVDWRTQTHSFQGLDAFVFNGTQGYRGTGGAPAALRTTYATASFFSTLGVGTELGRGWLPSDDEAGAASVMVVSDHFWRTSLGADPGAVGRTLDIGDTAVRVVGVLQPTARDMPWSADGYRPLGPLTSSPNYAARDNHPGLTVLARLRPGVTVAQASGDLGLVMQRLAAAYPASNQGETAVMVRLDEYLNGPYRSELWMLLAAVSLVLLLACANLAHLLLAQVRRREREFAIRSALGASSGDLFRQSACETLVLAALGGGAGLLLAWAAIPWLVRAPYPVPRMHQAHLDAGVMAFAAGAALMAALLMGTAPALEAARANLNRRLRARGHARYDAGLLLAEAAIAMVVVAGAGLLGRSLARAMAVDPGFAADGLVTVPLTHDLAGAPPYFDQVLRTVRGLPQAAAATAAMAAPLHGMNWTTPYLVRGQPAPPPAERPWAALNMVEPDYFHDLRAHLRAGRDFSAGDRLGAPLVAIVNATMARKLDAGGNVVGKSVFIQDDDQWRTVVGIVDDIHQLSLTAPAWPEIFVPIAQFPVAFVTLVVRARGAVGPLLRELAAAVSAAEPPQTMAAAVRRGFVRRDFLTGLMAGFGLLALLLAALGIYAITTQRVAAGMRELGVRMALGASPGSLGLGVLAGTLRLVAAGLAAGVAGAWLMGSFWGHLLFEVGRMDPVALGSGAAVLLLVAAAACLRPAWQAMRLDPNTVLRMD